ncbi:mycobactin polyketide synthase MbtD [Mycobacterium sp. NPDC003323]
MTARSLPDNRIPVLLSAHAEDLIAADAATIGDHLRRHPAAGGVTRVAATLARTRRVRKHRALIRAADAGELTDALRAVAVGDEHPLVTRCAPSSAARIAFVFPGQGSQWPSMGVEAYAQLPVYAAEVDRCAAAFDEAGYASPLAYLMAAPDAHTNDFTQVQIQGAQFVHSVALARVWQSHGITPDITVGHSLGEIGAAHIAGAIGLSDAVAIVHARATLLDRLTGPYRVAVLGMSPQQAQTEIAATPGWLELSVVNSGSSVAVSGDTEAIAAVVRRVARAGGFAREIEMWFPAHTTKLDPLRAELENLLPQGTFESGSVQFIGSATAQPVPGGTDFADYWYANLRSTVRFDRAVRAAVQAGAETFVEMSAHPALLYAMGDVLDDLPQTPLVVGSGRRDEPLVDRLSANIAAVAVSDPAYRWADFLDGTERLLPDFPFAPMLSQHHWAAPDPLPAVPGLKVQSETWEPVTAHPGAARRAAVVDLGDAAALVDTLHAHLQRVDPAEADLLVVIAPATDRFDATDAAAELAARIDTGLLRYVDALGAQAREVWLITVGGEQVRDGEPGPLPAHAALAAMHRSIGLEHPDHDFGHLDLPSWQLDDTTAALAVAALQGPAAELAVRDTETGPVLLRRGTRDADARVAAWSADILDEVVVTGGSGAVGTHFVRQLAARGARRIVLLGRGSVQVPQFDGVEIVAPRCDITDLAGLIATAAEFGGRGASLVIHAAATASITGHRELSGQGLADAVSAKVGGLANMAKAWPLRPEARMIVCSSVSGLWGGAGHVAYAAANRLADVQAAVLRAEGRHCTAVRWGLWPGDGIIDADEVTRVQRSGLRPLDPERAVEACLRDLAGDPLIFTADAARLAQFLGTAPAQPGTATETPDTSPADLDAAGVLRVALAAVLKSPDDSAPEPSASLLDLGVDSLLALDLRKKLKKATGANVPLARILGGATVAEVTEHIERTRREEGTLS